MPRSIRCGLRSTTSNGSRPAYPEPNSRRSKARSTAASSRSRWARSPPSTRAPPLSRTDHDDWKVVIKGDGRDTRGAGNASALITATFASGQRRRHQVDVHTDLTITGKVAQFGRGAIADVSSKLMGSSPRIVEDMIDETPAAEAPADAAAPEEAPASDAGVAAASPSAPPDHPQDRLARARGGRPARRGRDSRCSSASRSLSAIILLLLMLRRILERRLSRPRRVESGAR